MALPLIVVKTVIEMRLKALRKKIQRARKMWLKSSAQTVQRIAKKSIRKAKISSAPGEAPIGKSGALKKSIRYKVGRRDAWIGPTRPGAEYANILEQGSRRIEPRPFMGPALEKARPKIRRFRKI